MNTPRPRSEDEIVAAVAAGHQMAQMPLTAEDEAAVRRVLRGETTTEQELERLLAEIRAGQHRD